MEEKDPVEQGKAVSRANNCTNQIPVVIPRLLAPGQGIRTMEMLVVKPATKIRLWEVHFRCDWNGALGEIASESYEEPVLCLSVLEQVGSVVKSLFLGQLPHRPSCCGSYPLVRQWMVLRCFPTARSSGFLNPLWCRMLLVL